MKGDQEVDKFVSLMNIDKNIFNLYGALITIKRLPMVIGGIKTRKRNIELKNKRTSDTCYVIGLGPSLKNLDLTKLDGDMIVTNRFFKVDSSIRFNPVAYVMCDNAYFEEGRSINDLKYALKHYDKTIFVLNGAYKGVVDSIPGNKDNRYFIYQWNGFLNGDKDTIDLTKIIPMSSNVVCSALFVALYMGYKTIRLLGCDFNSFASTTAVHAYDEKNKERIWTMSNELFQYSFAADLHCQLNKYSLLNHQKIENATDGSLIDAYEHVKLPREMYREN